MTYQEGDPGHVSVHNALRDTIADAALRSAVEVELPPEAIGGQTGHVDAHNMINDALAVLADSGGAKDWADFRVAGVDPVEYVCDGSDGIEGATYKKWEMRVSAVVLCTRPGIAETILSGGGGGGRGGESAYPHGGGGAGGVYYNGGEFFTTENDGGAYVLSIGAGGGSGAMGGDTTLQCGNGTDTLVTKKIICGGGGTKYSTDYGSCRNQRPGNPGYIMDTQYAYPDPMSGGSGGQNANPGAPVCAGETRARMIFQGTRTVSTIGGSEQGHGTTGGTGAASGGNGGLILRVITEMPRN